ncbi:hypothetical protein ACIQTX_14490 [Microbacterium sp. NPDC090281]|uniref:hypothetical protein n=1 Tax=Microbacterium sp. NPDC090281 TaxID=3364208 RepID=UPI0038018A75
MAAEDQARETRLREIREQRRLEEVRARRDADAQDFTRWIYREVISPLGKWWWTTRGPEDLTRMRTFAAKHLHRAKLPEEGESTVQTAPLAEPVLGPTEDAPIAPIVDLGNYRRSA